MDNKLLYHDRLWSCSSISTCFESFLVQTIVNLTHYVTFLRCYFLLNNAQFSDSSIVHCTEIFTNFFRPTLFVAVHFCFCYRQGRSLRVDYCVVGHVLCIAYSYLWHRTYRGLCYLVQFISKIALFCVEIFTNFYRIYFYKDRNG